MAKLVAVTACPTGIAHTLMAAEALRKVATTRGHSIEVETQGSEGVKAPLSERALAEADAVIIAADIQVDTGRFAGKPIHRTSTAVAIRETDAVIAAALEAARVAAAGGSALAPGASLAATPPVSTPVVVTPTAATSGAPARRGKLVAITACPTGIAHTFMAAEALKKAAADAGYDIKVETQGSVGAKNTLTDEEIAEAEAVIIGADTHVTLERFTGKRLLRTSVGDALKRPKAVIAEALALPMPQGGPALSEQVAAAKTVRKGQETGPYKHLLTGVSFMLPMVVAGGLLIALSFVFGIQAAQEKGSLAEALMQSGQAAFALMVPVLAGYVAFSIADRPGLTPGLVGGMLAVQLKAGFLGGILAGFLAGYLARWLRDFIKLPRNLEGLKPVLILPLLSTLVVGLVMIYVIGTPVAFLMDALTNFLQGLSGANAVLLGALLGGMMALDMGGPLNKAAYAFSVGLLASNTYTPMAAVMAAGMTPPLGLALATRLAPKRFTLQEREAGGAAAVLGLAFITEGAIPFAAKDPLRVIPCLVLGSAVAGSLSMVFSVNLRAPHGGIFVLAIPGAVTPLLPFGLAILAGTVVTALAIMALKRTVPGEEPSVGVAGKLPA
ncbi:PTS fructose-like transporter subunit IIB [Hyalangium minutum]|uniref:protein-N(pi)-phosphohistidine--D-fructose phosphotransferase n=1 Tax=Hyalangium minutum TaxID=394096 RepID=A0A085WB62_9BACT|nr:PTS fructose-like transporter subunit IIB [Hyalangium minutum]KFE64925.1 PTS system, fructose-specific IIB component [Hyalangium minutum]